MSKSTWGTQAAELPPDSPVTLGEGTGVLDEQDRPSFSLPDNITVTPLEHEVVLETVMSSWEIRGNEKIFERKYVEYKVSCLRWDFTNKHLDEWSVYHRYTDFEQLHKRLQPAPAELKLPGKLSVMSGMAGKSFVILNVGEVPTGG